MFKLPKMQFHEKKVFGLFDFTSFFAWTFLHFLARSTTRQGTHFEPRFRGSVRMRGPEDTKSGKDNGPWRVSTNSALAVEKENRQNRWKVVGFWPLNQLFGFFFF